MHCLTSTVCKFAIIVLLLFFYSCTNTPKNNTAVFKALQEGLTTTENIITKQNNLLYQAYEARLADPRSHEKAIFWQPKAMVIKKHSFDFCNYIDNLEIDLKKEAGYSSNDKGSFKENDVAAVNHFFDRRGKELYEKLEKYKQDLLNVDTMLNLEFKDKIGFIPKQDGTLINNQDGLIQTFFYRVTPVAALAMLSQFKNKAKEIENQMVEYCYHKSTIMICGFMRHSYITALNSSYLKPGQILEVYAGVGYFKTQTKIEIKIKGKNVPINVDGVATYKTKASAKPGKHYLPVQISYLGDDGIPHTILKTLEYTVADIEKDK